jgi:RNA polymerase sigma-70 factor (ECF subfamily)
VEPSDEALCRGVADREPGAFDLLVERYQERAYRIAWSIVRDREDARECAQDAFVRLHEAAGTFAGQAKFSTWFYRILVNCCLDHRRRGRGWRRLLVWRDAADEEREDDPIERHPAPVEDPGEHVDEDRRMSRLWAAVDTLSPRQRAVVQLQCREGLATKDIAEVRDAPASRGERVVSAHPSERLLPYRRGELAAAERAGVEAHLAGCPECRQALADFAAIAARLERAPEPAPPLHWGAFRADLRERLAGRRAPERRARGLTVGPAVLAAGLAAVVLYLGIPGQNGRAPVGDQAVVDNALLASRLDLIQGLDLVQRLDLLEDFDVIGRLDAVEPREQG